MSPRKQVRLSNGHRMIGHVPHHDELFREKKSDTETHRFYAPSELNLLPDDFEALISIESVEKQIEAELARRAEMRKAPAQEPDFTGQPLAILEQDDLFIKIGREEYELVKLEILDTEKDKVRIYWPPELKEEEDGPSEDDDDKMEVDEERKKKKEVKKKMEDWETMDYAIRIGQLTERIKELEAEIKLLRDKTKMSEMLEHVETLEKKNSAQKEQLRIQQNQVGEAYHLGMIEELKKEKRKMEEEKEASRKEIEEFKEERKKMEEKMRGLEDEQKRMMEVEKESRMKIERLKEEKAMMEEEKEARGKEIDELEEEKMRGLKEEAKKARNRIEELNQEKKKIEKLKKEKREMEEATEASRKKIDKLKEERDKMVHEMTEMRENMEKLMEEKSMLERKYRMVNQSIVHYKEMTDNLMQRATDLEKRKRKFNEEISWIASKRSRR